MSKQVIEVSNYTELTIGQIRPMLDLAFHTRTNVFLLGDPGLGKTETIGRFASELGGARFVTMVASMLDRLDLAGLPYRTADNTTEFALMSSVAEATQELNPDGPVTVFYLNEVNSAPDSVQPALLRFLNERAISGYRLRDNVMIIADGNHATTSRLAREMPEPAKRRFLWLHVRVDKEEWMAYSAACKCDSRVTAFIEAHAAEGVLCDFRTGEARGRTTYACPASWSRLGEVLPKILADLPDDRSKQAWIDGQIGAGFGKLFWAFLEHQHKIPAPKEILKTVMSDEKNVVIPKDIDTRYMLLGMVSNLVREKRDPADINASLRLTKLLLNKELGEEAVYFFRSFTGEKEVAVALPALPAFASTMIDFRKRPGLFQAVIAAAVDKAARNTTKK